MLINMLGFNIAWFGLIFLGNHFVPIALLMLLAHLKWCITNKSELKLILIITLIGVCIDSLFQLTNVFIFASDTHIPLWLIFVWSGFATTLNHSLAFLANHKSLQILAGLVVAPLSYRSGEVFGAVEFGASYLTTHLILGITWALLFLLFFLLKSHFNNKEISNA